MNTIERHFPTVLGAVITLLVIGILSMTQANAMGRDKVDPPTDGVDQGFRFDGGQCLNDKKEAGLNFHFMGECGDLRSLSLYHQSFDRKSFNGANFSMTDLSDSNFTSCTFTGADFFGARTVNFTCIACDFRDSSWLNADLRYSHLDDSNFDRARMDGAQLEGTIAATTDFSFAGMSNTDLRNADLSWAHMTGAVLWGAMYNAGTQLPFSHQEAAARGMRYVP